MSGSELSHAAPARPSTVFPTIPVVEPENGRPPDSLPARVREIVAGYSNRLAFRLNGRDVVIDDPDPAVTLVDYLRGEGQTGTKVGCGQGGCGACTVMISRRTADGDDHLAINACLRPLVAVDGTHVTTVEGIGNARDGLDPVQHRIALGNGSQCGFCTPGFVMNAHAFLRGHPCPTERQVEDLFGGNLCRCTGYRPILHAMRSFARDRAPVDGVTPECEADPGLGATPRPSPCQVGLDGLGDPSGPPTRGHHYSRPGLHWFRPAGLSEAHELKALLSRAPGPGRVRLVVGNTASAIYPEEKAACLIDVSRVPELNVAEAGEGGLRVGASVPIQVLLELAEASVAREPEGRTAGLRALLLHAKALAGIQVRNAGSVGGNIAITKAHTRAGEPFPSDLFTVLATLGATLTVRSDLFDGGLRSFELDDLPAVEDLPDDALFVHVEIPWTAPGERVRTYRVARRPQMAHPIVNAGFRCRLDGDGRAVPGELAVVYGGLASCNRRLEETERALAGRRWDRETLRAVLPVLAREVEAITIPMDGEGFTTDYRRRLALGFFYKFFVHVAKEVRSGEVAPANLGADVEQERPISRGRQAFRVGAGPGPIARPIVKHAACAQATGEIRYASDEPLPGHGDDGVPVPSRRAHARFRFTRPPAELDALLRDRFPGFTALITAEDVPGRRKIGIGGDDPVFCDGLVTSVSAPIALALARTTAVARRVAEYVGAECVEYEDLPATLTLEEAIERRSLLDPPAGFPTHPEHDRHVLVRREGSDAAWLEAPDAAPDGLSTLSGRLATGAQAHFYMEPQCAIATPGAYDQMTVRTSTQNPNGDQVQIARVLGVKANQVTVCVEQIGGGFGGKQNRAVFIGAMAAVAARKVRRPVRVAYDRATDTRLTGKRHPYLGTYDVAYSDDGTLHGMKLDYCSDGGDTADCSFAVLKGSCMMSDGCYSIPTFQAGGNVYRTNKASNTAFRTFGQVQPHLVQEEAIERVAFELSRRLGRRVRPEAIRRRNLYRSAGFEGADATHFGQPLWFCALREQWDRVYAETRFEERAEAVDAFNVSNRWKKRGIAMVPLKYGIGFKQFPAMNTSSALVQISKDDGSITVIHGGVEMGQGLHTKIAQVVADELGVPLEYVRVAGNHTDAINNAPPTAASTGFDLNGGAVALACRTLRKRLEGFCESNEGRLRASGLGDWRAGWRDAWPALVGLAWMECVSLIAAETFRAPHHAQPVEHFPRGKFFAYFAYGFSVSEVEVDVLTGESTVLRADVYYDAGRSPNPAIDVGQIEGGYVQGLGFVTTEEVLFDDRGGLVTDNIWNYKPPCTKTIPLDFRVTLLEHSPESLEAQEKAKLLAVASSKSTSEPTLSLGVSAYFAIKHAVLEARREQTGRDEWVRLDVPATCQRVQEACGVDPGRLDLD